jgi:hypothetical protein
MSKSTNHFERVKAAGRDESRSRHESREQRRRGVTLIPVMICLTIITLLGGVLLKIVLLENRQQRASEWRALTVCLVESGLDRAVARLKLSHDYTGERWHISDEAIGHGASAIVTIEVQPADGTRFRQTIRVHADYLRDGASRARLTKSFEISTGGN